MAPLGIASAESDRFSKGYARFFPPCPAALAPSRSFPAVLSAQNRSGQASMEQSLLEYSDASDRRNLELRLRMHFYCSPPAGTRGDQVLNEG